MKCAAPKRWSKYTTSMPGIYKIPFLLGTEWSIMQKFSRGLESFLLLAQKMNHLFKLVLIKHLRYLDLRPDFDTVRGWPGCNILMRPGLYFLPQIQWLGKKLKKSRKDETNWQTRHFLVGIQIEHFPICPGKRLMKYYRQFQDETRLMPDKKKAVSNFRGKTFPGFFREKMSSRKWTRYRRCLILMHLNLLKHRPLWRQ